MGCRTYETQLGESTLQLKMKKKDAERTISRIKRAYNVNKHRREINGLTTDAEPRTHV